MRYTLIVSTLLSLAALSGRAQTVRRDTAVSYLDRQWAPVNSLAEATYLVKTVPGDSLGGVKLRYTLDGWLVERQEYRNLASRLAHGLCEEYHLRSRQLKVVSHYQQGKLNGELRSYYLNGRLQRREQYRNYVSQGGECFSQTGEPVAFVPYLVMPSYRGGVPALMSFIGNNLKYPKEALRAELQARIFVHFIVSEDGKVKNARVAEPGYPSLDAEALRVVNLLRKWKPGRIDGEVKEVSFTLPVTFQIQ